MPQATLTIVTEVVRQGDPKSVQDLSTTLDALGGKRGSSALPFARIDGIHFARFAIVEDPDAKRPLPARPDPILPTLLVFSIVFDETSGDRGASVERIVAAARPSLDAIYASCAGYPGPTASAGEVKAYLLGKNVEPFLFYQGAEGVTVEAVRKSGELRKRLEDELDRLMRNGASAQTPVALARALRSAVPPVDARIVPASIERLSNRARALRIAAWSVVVFVVPAALLVGVPPGIGWLFGAPRWLLAVLAVSLPFLLALTIFLQEEADARRLEREPDVASGDHLEQVRDEEDHVVQNALTHCAIVKSGRLRYYILKYVFWTIGKRVGLVDRFEGALGGIASIHFARWVQLDQARGANRRRLLFLSDYDGSWESYLGEFVDRAAPGLTAVWSNTENFPKTRFVAAQGAQDEQRFKNWTRNRQLKTPVWYTAYPDCTLHNVENDVRIAQLLSSAKTADQDTAWLALL